MPSVSEVGDRIFRLLRGGEAVRQIGITLLRITLGFAAAFVTALVGGIFAARNLTFRCFCEPALILSLTVPGLAWSLLCVIWFGVGLLAPTVVIALGIVPVMMLRVIHGMRSIDGELIEMVTVFQLFARDRLTMMWIPDVVPHLIAGARVGLSLAWKVIVLVELFGLSNGVGYQLNAEFRSENVAGVLAWTVGGDGRLRKRRAAVSGVASGRVADTIWKNSNRYICSLTLRKRLGALRQG